MCEVFESLKWALCKKKVRNYYIHAKIPKNNTFVLAYTYYFCNFGL